MVLRALMSQAGFFHAAVGRTGLGCPLPVCSELHSTVLSWSVLCCTIGWAGLLLEGLASLGLSVRAGLGWSGLCCRG
jgi:hypothetical protein